jgi:hypothetical protein
MTPEMTPENIRRALTTSLEPGERPLAIFKTAWKPRFGTPILWLSVTTNRLILFSTLRGGTVFTGVKFGQINAISTEQGGRVIRILFWDNETADLNFALDESVPSDEVKQLLEMVRTRLTKPGGMTGKT